MFKERVYHFGHKDWKFTSRGSILEVKGKQVLLEYSKLGFGIQLGMEEMNGNLQFSGNCCAFCICCFFDFW